VALQPDPTPRRRRTPAIGALALVAALIGGGVAAIVTVSLDRGARDTQTVTVRELVRTTTVAAPATSSDTATATSDGAQRTLEEIYQADAPGVVTVLTTTPDGKAEGSGFVLDTSGYILTNEHVIDGATSVWVSFSNSDNVKAKIVGSDASTDLAVLRVDLPASALHPLPLGSSSAVAVGDAVVAIGNPFGLDRTLTAGIVSALHRQIQGVNTFTIDNAIQTDAAINHGNSGGPLIDRSGAVIGINAQLPQNSDVDGNVGVGFAIPIDTAKVVIPQLEQTGHAAHPWLGLEGDTLDTALAQAQHVRSAHGVLIEAMVPGSPIAKAGIVGGSSSVVVNGMSYCIGGDVITEIDGDAVTTIEQLQDVLAAHSPGQTLTLRVVHAGGAEKDVRVTLGTQPQTTPQASSRCSAGRP
jgi:S1-C subfamily serine protease